MSSIVRFFSPVLGAIGAGVGVDSGVAVTVGAGFEADATTEAGFVAGLTVGAEDTEAVICATASDFMEALSERNSAVSLSIVVRISSTRPIKIFNFSFSVLIQRPLKVLNIQEAY